MDVFGYHGIRQICGVECRMDRERKADGRLIKDGKGCPGKKYGVEPRDLGLSLLQRGD
jgi:hypothetical protein